MLHHGGARGLGIIHVVELERCNDNAAHPAAHSQKLRHVNLMALNYDVTPGPRSDASAPIGTRGFQNA